MATKRLSLKLKETVDEQPIKKIKLDNANASSEIDEILLLKTVNLNRLKFSFFNQDCIPLSKSLLGKYLIRILKTDTGEEKCLVGKIVECEAYLGGDDKASHTYNNKRTERVEAMYMKPGTLYVYNIYGMYCCMNISSKGDGSGVLIRALEPIHGIDLIKQNRKFTQSNLKGLTNGPSKLCMAFDITKSGFNKQDLETSDTIWLQDSIESIQNEEFQIVKAKRVGIDYAGDKAINQLYRFYIKNNKYVSVKSKQEELEESL